MQSEVGHMPSIIDELRERTGKRIQVISIEYDEACERICFQLDCGGIDFKFYDNQMLDIDKVVKTIKEVTNDYK